MNPHGPAQDRRLLSPDGWSCGSLGAIWDGSGVRFALYSEHATAVDLELIAGGIGSPAERRIRLERDETGVWSTRIAGIGPGQLYAYRVHGRWNPEAGDRFDAHKLLVDPYARAIAGPLHWNPLLLDRESASLQGDIDAASAQTGRDSAACVPPCLVVDPSFDWGDDRPPATAWADTVLYECHVKGMTAQHPQVRPSLRGTYLGLCSPPVVEHLRRLGVTAVELLPIHHSFTERRLLEHGLTNYWGYNTIGYFAPDPRFATGAMGQQVREFKEMVRTLHAAGIEVILDVVFNHTGEGDRMGPTVCFRGIDNRTYYSLDPHDRRRYLDYSGCGNCLDLQHPQVLRLVADSLRYWVAEMHVDGFRFDLAPALVRRGGALDVRGGIIGVIHQDPLLSRVKLIAEPWDLGIDGHRLGGFPPHWSEWNDRYRDTTRRFWRGDAGQMAEFASRVAGSRDVFASELHRPRSSINFVSCHDGFTLADLVRYSRKHNEANLEGNRDGCDDCHIGDFGVEGESSDPAVRAIRSRVTRSLIATLGFSLGTPMLSHGDEMLRSQRGNNNVYCQDNESSWVPWNWDTDGREQVAFTQRVFELRRRHAALRRTFFLTGEPGPGGSIKDVTWLRPDGEELEWDDWQDDERRALAVLLRDDDAGAFGATPSTGPIPLLLLLCNGAAVATLFRRPAMVAVDGEWSELLTSAPGDWHTTRRGFELPPHALVLLAGRARAAA